MTVFYTSDPHVMHLRATEMRGYDNTDDHDLAIRDGWLNTVKKDDDLVYVLGDLSLKRPSTVLPFFDSLPGRKRLILGNHDPAHPMHREAPKHARAYFDVFESVGTAAHVSIEGVTMLLSHFPYEADRKEARHMQWRLPDLGIPLIHGHLHVKERWSRSLAGTPQVHVGVDAWDMRPASAIEVYEVYTNGVVG